jgi:hypothetical protein
VSRLRTHPDGGADLAPRGAGGESALCELVALAHNGGQVRVEFRRGV